MPVFLSPGVITQEIDNTTYTQEISNTNGAFAGAFKWGPVDTPTYISQGEKDLIATFGTSDNTYYKSVLVAADFLSYANTMWVVRQVGPTAKNAFPTSFLPKLVKNDAEYEGGTFSGVDFFGKYPGSFANGLLVDIVDSAGFSTWEFKNSFEYRPGNGEYSIAVVDTTGNISGTGANKQIERLLVSGSAVGGIQQSQTLTITGTANGGVKQKEIITFSGTSTGGTITVNGTNVVLLNGDTQDVVATKVASALGAVSATYDSAAAITNMVNVTFATPTSNQTKIASGSSTGVTWSSLVSVVGDSSFVVDVYGEDVYLEYGDTAAEMTTKIYNVFGTDLIKFKDVLKTSSTTINYTYVDYGQVTLATFTTKGLTVTPNVTTVGSSNISISVFGQSVDILNGDTSDTIAGKIALNNNVSGLFGDVWVSGSSVYYESFTNGAKTPQTTPASQASLTFDVKITTTGSLGTVVEKYELMVEDPTAKFEDGSTKFWFDAINQGSDYVRAGDRTVALSDRSVTLIGGVDDNNINVTAGYALFSNKEQYDLQYLIAGAVSVAEQQAIIDIADGRSDCMAFVAPMMNDVVNNAGNEAEDVDFWRLQEIERSSTYAFAVDNWAYVFDKYSNVYRWIPATGGTAGIFARSAQEHEQWTPPAGLNRGRYKNYIKLAWNASEGERNLLYPSAVNSIVSFPGTGIVLYGDKTLTQAPTAFSRVNTRWAFIVAKKSLASMAKYFLFEINNAFTRAQFVNAARPFLRNMKTRNAFEDFRIIADESNNDASVVMQNRMIVQVLIKPLFSINWIVLNLTGVRPDVSFDEYVQK